MNAITNRIRPVAYAAGFDLDRYQEDAEGYSWDYDDIDAEKGILKAVKNGVIPSRVLDTAYDGVYVIVEGWQIIDGLWIGRHKSKDKYRHVWEPWTYCNGQNWDDIWQG